MSDPDARLNAAVEGHHAIECLLVVMAIMLSFMDLTAQAQEPAAGQTRVRIRTNNDAARTLKGRLVTANADTFKVQVDRRLVAIPVEFIERIDVVEGTRHYLVLGAVIGGVVFALINRYQPLGCDWKGGCDSAELMKGALYGAAIGGAIGFSLHGDRWVEVRPEVLYTPSTLSGSRLRGESKMISGFGFSARLMLGGGS